MSPRLGQDCCRVHPGRKSKTWEPRGGQREREGRTTERVIRGKVGERERERERVMDKE